MTDRIDEVVARVLALNPDIECRDEPAIIWGARFCWNGRAMIDASGEE